MTTLFSPLLLVLFGTPARITAGCIGCSYWPLGRGYIRIHANKSCQDRGDDIALHQRLAQHPSCHGPSSSSHSRMSTRRFASLATDLFTRQDGGATPPTPHHDNPVVAFIIGLAIVLLASILNAAGLNLTKLDHVRCSRMLRACCSTS